MLTDTQKSVRNHVILLCSDGHMITKEVISHETFRDLVKETCLEFGYIPVFSPLGDGYLSFVATKMTEEC